MKLLALLLLILGEHSQAQEVCKEIFAQELTPVLREFLDFEASIVGLEGGAGKVSLMTEMQRRRREINEAFEFDILSELKRIEDVIQQRGRLRPAPQVPPSVLEPAKLKELSRVQLEEMPDILQQSPPAVRNDRGSFTEFPVEGIQWNESETVMVVNSGNGAQAFEVPSLKPIRKFSENGFLSRDGSLWVTRSGRDEKARLRFEWTEENRSPEPVLAPGFELASPEFFTGPEIGLIDPRAPGQRLRFNLAEQTSETIPDRDPNLLRNGEIKIERDLTSVKVRHLKSGEVHEFAPNVDFIISPYEDSILVHQRGANGGITFQFLDLENMRLHKNFLGYYDRYSPKSKWIFVEGPLSSGLTETTIYEPRRLRLRRIQSQGPVQFLADSGYIIYRSPARPMEFALGDLTDDPVRPLRTVNGPKAGVSPSGQYILTVDSRNVLRIWGSK